MSSLVGQTLNSKYRVITRVGAGSMGTVYLAEHVGLKKKVALKVLHPDLQLQGDSLQRFQQEGIAAGRFSHPNAIQIFDFDEVHQDGASQAGIYYLAMEFVEGINLKKFLEQKGPLDVKTAVDCTRQILATLTEAHRQGIVHRDLKPENVMLIPDPAGEGYQVKVLDFGISKLIDLQREDVLATQTGRILGTPLYMSPEQCLGQTVDERSDIYAVGLILREMLTGKPPFDGDNVTEILIKHTSEMIPSPRIIRPDLKLPKDIEKALEKSLAKDRGERFASATAMMEALGDVNYDKLAKGSLISLSGKKVAIGLGACLLIAGAVWFFGFREGGSGGEPERTQGDSSANQVAIFRLSDRPPEELSEIEREYVSILRQIRTYVDNNQLTQAQTLLDRALQMSCRDGEFFECRGWYYFRKGDLDAAQQEFEAGLEAMPQDAESLAGLGWIALSYAQNEPAKERFQEALRRDSQSILSLVGMGRVQDASGEGEAARKSFEQAVSLNNESAVAHFNLGWHLLRNDDVDSAVTELVAAKRYGRDPEIFSKLGEAYRRQGKLDDAEIQWREALDLDPGSSDVRLQLVSLLMERERYTEAESQIITLLSRDASRAETHFLRAGIALATDRRDQAEGYLQDGLARDVDALDAKFLLAVIKQRAGDLNEAFLLYDSILSRDETNFDARTNRGLICVAREDYIAAKEDFEFVLDAQPQNLIANLYLGFLYMEHLPLDEYPNAFERASECFNAYLDAGGTDKRVARWLNELSG